MNSIPVETYKNGKPKRPKTDVVADFISQKYNAEYFWGGEEKSWYEYKFDDESWRWLSVSKLHIQKLIIDELKNSEFYLQIGYTSNYVKDIERLLRERLKMLNRTRYYIHGDRNDENHLKYYCKGCDGWVNKNHFLELTKHHITADNDFYAEHGAKFIRMNRKNYFRVHGSINAIY